MNTIAVIVREGMPAAPNKRLCQRLAALAMVREALADNQVVIARSHEGAPRLLGSALSVTISHDKHVVAVALSAEPGIGIDLQHPRPLLRKVRDRILHPDEAACQWPAEHPGVAGMSSELALWTAKEAVVKASLRPSIVMTDIVVRPDFTLATAFGVSYALHHWLHPAAGPEAAGVCLAVRL